MSTTRCRGCGYEALELVLSLGSLPLAEVLVTESQLSRPVDRYPLDVMFCSACSLVQLRETVSPSVLYGGEYPYLSSVSATLVARSKELADELIASRRLSAESLVIEIASNDGYLLQHFVARGVPVVGIDPARQAAMVARGRGVPTRCEFFDEELATRLVEGGMMGDVVIVNNVLNLVPALSGFVSGMRRVLKEGGIAVVEVPYVGDLVENCLFDTIYHQNLCYFSVTALDHLFRRQALFLREVRRIDAFGGSLRLFCGLEDFRGESVRRLLDEERERRLDSREAYLKLADSVAAVRDALRALLEGMKREHRRIAVYGAGGGMSSTLLGYLALDRQLIDFAVDQNPLKHGRYIGGSELKIYPTERLAEDMPDYTVLLAWNYADEVMAQQETYRRKGGHFVIPLPKLVIV